MPVDSDTRGTIDLPAPVFCGYAGKGRESVIRALKKGLSELPENLDGVEVYHHPGVPRGRVWFAADPASLSILGGPDGVDGCAAIMDLRDFETYICDLIDVQVAAAHEHIKFLADSARNYINVKAHSHLSNNRFIRLLRGVMTEESDNE